MTKEKSQGFLFRSVLKCIPYLIEEVGRSDKITEIIPQHGISIDPGVREEAVQVLNRIVRDLPHRRFTVMRGMSNFILRLPDEFPLLIQTSLGRLLELLRFWRACLADDKVGHDASEAKRVQRNDGFKKSSFHQSGDAIEFRASEIDAVGLIFLSSVDSQIRHTALELLRCVRALRNDIREVLMYGQADLVKHEAEPIFIIDVLEENGVCSTFTLSLNLFITYKLLCHELSFLFLLNIPSKPFSFSFMISKSTFNFQNPSILTG